MWDLPRPGVESLSPALAGGFLSIAPPGKSPHTWVLKHPHSEITRWLCQLCLWTFLWWSFFLGVRFRGRAFLKCPFLIDWGTYWAHLQAWSLWTCRGGLRRSSRGSQGTSCCSRPDTNPPAPPSLLARLLETLLCRLGPPSSSRAVVFSGSLRSLLRRVWWWSSLPQKVEKAFSPVVLKPAPSLTWQSGSSLGCPKVPGLYQSSCKRNIPAAQHLNAVPLDCVCALLPAWEDRCSWPRPVLAICTRHSFPGADSGSSGCLLVPLLLSEPCLVLLFSVVASSSSLRTGTLLIYRIPLRASIPGLPWACDHSSTSVLSSQSHLLCVCVQIRLLPGGHLSLDEGATWSRVASAQWHLQRHCFQTRSYPQVPGIRIWPSLWGGKHNSVFSTQNHLNYYCLSPFRWVIETLVTRLPLLISSSRDKTWSNQADLRILEYSNWKAFIEVLLFKFYSWKR